MIDVIPDNTLVYQPLTPWQLNYIKLEFNNKKELETQYYLIKTKVEESNNKKEEITNKDEHDFFLNRHASLQECHCLSVVRHLVVKLLLERIESHLHGVNTDVQDADVRVEGIDGILLPSDSVLQNHHGVEVRLDAL